jgi:hypothetical protein
VQKTQHNEGSRKLSDSSVKLQGLTKDRDCHLAGEYFPENFHTFTMTAYETFRKFQDNQ